MHTNKLALCYGPAAIWSPSRPVRVKSNGNDLYAKNTKRKTVTSERAAPNCDRRSRHREHRCQTSGHHGLSLQTGKDVWKATNFDASYSSPIEVRRGRQPAALVVTRLNPSWVRAADGTVLGQTDFGARGPPLMPPQPIAIGADTLFADRQLWRGYQNRQAPRW